MDFTDGFPGHFGNFAKDEFEADWTKMAECRFSQVYEVKLKAWQEKCVLKCFHPPVCSKSSYRKIINEVSKIAKVKFKYIVAIYGVCSEATAVVMEHMSNGSLNNLLASHTLMWPKKFQMVHEISMGVNFLHSMNPPILHLNLKTSNILLDDHLHAKISDFALIHWEEGMSNTLFMESLTARGNISYIPPETFTQSSDPPGTASDVYSFGIIIWEILTQQKPYAGWSMTTVLLQVSQGRRPCLEIIPEWRPNECDRIICMMKQCWDQEPRKRPQFSDIVKTTESLCEVLKIPGSIQCHMSGEERQRSNYPRLDSPINQISLSEILDPLSDEKLEKDNILSFLSRKDFGSFRQSLKQEHVHTVYTGKNSLLHYTVTSKDAASVEHVLNLGADINATTAQGYTPLIVAVLHRLHDIISLLLEHGAVVGHGDEDQWTALHFAAQNGDDRTVRLLLDKGAVVDARERAGWMPLHLACQNGHEPVVRLLLSRMSEEAVGEREGHGRTPLHLASAYGHLSIAKLLLSQGADPNATDGSLSTPLHLSAEEGHNRVVRQLLKSGVATDSANSQGYNPLHLAALKGHTGICRQLLSNGANPNCTTLQAWTPMHLAALKGNEAIVVQLVCNGGSTNAKSENGWTPLHLACHQSEPEVTSVLLEAAADPNATEASKGWSPLHFACNSVSFQCVLHLIAHHADVNALSFGKAAPLHVAIQHGCVPIVKTLLLNGADKSLLDSSGSSTLDVAKRCEKLEIVQLLES
ncbi:ankyrin repeat and protein kinase domain-containing protein 1 [Takifugu flavidus]|uniref:ankyrin repeat and protein kinase domain-containing protein 1 n=1 Tax=Takifugu flavidus TaxID=433684 RepID=UPI00254449E9|nr:ankyrin repeat and protein kinase domain-containing protein 1 [Takifugu flavidus]